MSGWHYQLLGEEFGPVSDSALAALLHEGTLGPKDLVRPADSALWVAAELALAGHTDQSAMLTDLSELSFEFEESTTEQSSRLNRPGQESSKTNDTDRQSAALADDASDDLYYYQIRGQSHGPVPRETLIRMAEQGRLTDTDMVRTAAEFLWQAAAEYHEFSAAFLLRKAESQGRQRVIPAGRTADSQTTAAAIEPTIEKPAATPEAKERRIESVMERPEERRTPKPPGSAKPRANNKKRRQQATNSPAELDEDVFQEVFADDPAAPAQSAGHTQATVAEGHSDSRLKPMPAPQAPPAVPTTSPSQIPIPPVAADRMGIPSGTGQRASLMPTRPPASRKTVSRSRAFDFDFEFSTPMKVLSGMLLLAAFWFGYGPVKRYLTTSESHYISRAEEAIRTFEGLEATMDREKYGQTVETVTRELEAYLVILKDAGSTGKTSMACAGALNRVVEFGRLDPSNDKLRSKLLTEAKQLISVWKGN